MKALEPIQVIATESGGPYAFRTRLGWCIVGPIMNGNNKDSISCRRVAVRDASTSQVALHHFLNKGFHQRHHSERNIKDDAKK